MTAGVPIDEGTVLAVLAELRSARACLEAAEAACAALPVSKVTALHVRVDPMTGQITQVGDMGASYSSSGDTVAVDGFGTVQTVPGSNGDTLVKLAPSSFAATPIGSGTGFSQLWGIAFWKNKIYGFANTGEFVLIDDTTGVGTMVTQTNEAWWGAAVTTLAPVVQ